MNDSQRYVIAMPGQAFEREGMARELAEHPSFKRIAAGFNSMTGGNFERWVTTAPMEEIGERFTAPTVMVLYSAVCAEIAAEKFGTPSVVAGYSLGFYAAALFARSLRATHVLHWLERINAENEKTFPAGKFGFAVATGITAWEAEELLKEWDLESVCIANINNPRQVVMAGPVGDITRAGRMLKNRVMDFQSLPLDIPLHTEYMVGAKGSIAQWWATVPAATPRIPLLSPVDGSLIQSGERVKSEMSVALAAPNDWVSVCSRLSQMNIEWMLDLSPGGELGRMARWTDRNIDVKPVSSLWKDKN